MNRYVIAIDSDGKMYMRETLTVSHDLDTGNVTYIARPINDGVKIYAALAECLGNLAGTLLLFFYTNGENISGGGNAK